MRVKDKSKRLAIIDQTLNLVNESGIAGIKMATIAKRVNISVSTLYVYYENKEKLIQGVHDDVIKELSKRSREAIKQDLPFKLKLKSFWLFWIQLMIDQNKSFSFLTQLKQSPYSHFCNQETRQFNRTVAFELFNNGKHEGVIKDIDNDMISYIMEAMLLKAVTLISQQKLSLNQKEMDMWYSFFWDAIKS